MHAVSHSPLTKSETIWYSMVRVSLVQFSCSVVSDSLQPHELQHARPPCPSPRKMQINTTKKCHFTLIEMATSKKKKEKQR